MPYFLPLSVIDGLKIKKYVESSIKIFDTNIKRIFVSYLNKNLYNLSYLICNIELILDKIEEESNTSSKKTLIHSLWKVLSIENYDNIDMLEKKYNNICDIHDKEYKYKQLDADRFVSLENINKSYKMCKSSLNKIIVIMYSMFPALRGQDYFNLKVIQGKEKLKLSDYGLEYTTCGYNYIDINNGVLVIGDHKTSKNYGIKIIKIPENILNYLRDHCEQKKNGDYFFTDDKNNQFNSAKFANYLHKLFSILVNCKLSVDDLRKIYVAEVVGYIQTNYDLDKQKKYRMKMAEIMGHSISTQEFIYSGFKYDTNLNMSSNGYMKDVLYMLDNTEILLITKKYSECNTINEI